jgi:exosortase/archaeosortase family protein
MKKDSKKVFYLSVRYLFVILASTGNFYLFYKLMTTPTVAAVAAALRPFFDILVVDNYIYVRGVVTEIVPSCVAGSAYFLLFFLVLSTADIKPVKRMAVLAFSFATLFIFNIARMVFLVFIIHKPYFDTVHFVLQNLLLTVIVVAIWIGITSTVGIKTIPVYSDMKHLYSLTKKQTPLHSRKVKSGKGYETHPKK